MTAELPNVPIARKPSWLSRESFDELLLRYGGMPYCAVTGEMDDLSVDHIVPRYLGGTDDPSNLQFLVNRINAKKGIKPDTYWSRSFYWDKMPNVDSFRGGQRLLFNELLEREDWFGRPISQISRNLYLNAWVVGAGKTLGIAAGAWAANYVIRKRWGAAVRADKVLVGSHYAGDRQTVHQLVGSAVKHKLGVPRDVKAKNNSDWDTPQVHAILHRPDVQAEIVGWVAGRLIDMDLCPALAALRDPALVSS